MRPRHTRRDETVEIRGQGGRTRVVDIRRRCSRCQIILAEAPSGANGMCGWCEQGR